MAGLAEALAARIARDGPMRLDAWMAACNAAYYAARDPFGLGGDFVTAPEISQMFGEIIGGWVGDLWLRAGTPAVRLVELGPGRGTLMADALRVLRRLPGWDAPLALVETSPVLRAAQAQRLTAEWFDSIDAIPDDRALIVIANEFFDALPVRQFDGAEAERGVGLLLPLEGGGERRAERTARVGVVSDDAGGSPPPAAPAAGDAFASTGASRLLPPRGGIFMPVTLPAHGRVAGEVCEAAAAITTHIADRIRRHGGALLVIDYGYADTVAHDSLQALRNAATADPFAAPGASDLTAHVDFTALARAAGALRVSGPVAQGVWLTRLGIEARATALRQRNPGDAAAIAAALVRLTAPAQMGSLFKAMALSAPDWPIPAGFDA